MPAPLQLASHPSMFGVADYPSFVLAVIVFLAIPGPGNLALVTSTGKGGWRGGAACAFGLIVGDQALMWLAVAGVSALLAAWPPVLQAVRWLGSAYLGWIGLRLLLARPGDRPVIRIEPRAYARQGAVITLLNPKAIVFYMAFFPLFVDPATPHRLRAFAAMALTIAVLTALYAALVVWATTRLAARFRATPAIGLRLQRAAGVFLIGFGIRLALSR